MSFPRNTWFDKTDDEILLEDLKTHLVNPQHAFGRNARSWKTWAVNKELPPAEIAIRIMDGVAAHRKNIANIDALIADAPKLGRVIAKMQGGSRKDIDDILVPYKAEIDRLEAEPKADYAQIIALCNRIITEFPHQPRLFQTE